MATFTGQKAKMLNTLYCDLRSKYPPYVVLSGDWL